MRPLDEPGDIGYDEAQVPACSHAQIGNERGERIVGDLRARSAHTCDKRRLAGRGHANQSSVGHELHLQLNPAFLSRFSQFGERRRTTGRRDEVDVAAPADATLSNCDALAVVGKVGDKLARLLRFVEIFPHDGSNRNLEHQIVARCPMHTGTLAVRSALGFEMVLETVVYQRRKTGVGFDDNVAAMPAVTAIGAAFGNMRLAPKRHAPGTAIAAAHMYAHFVNEHRASFPHDRQYAGL